MIRTPPVCWGCPSGVRSGTLAGVGGHGRGAAEGWPDGPGVLRAASINAEIFPPDRCGPVEGPTLRGPLALNKIVTRPQSVFVLADGDGGSR
jgi:hypothetical protein